MGSCACYCLSWLLGKQLAHAIWPDRLAAFGAEVQRQKRALLGYIIFLRITPLLPNTFINVASPIVGVPLLPFAVGTLLGTGPQNFVAVTAGNRLGELTSLKDLYDPRFMLLGESGREEEEEPPAPVHFRRRSARSLARRTLLADVAAWLRRAGIAAGVLAALSAYLQRRNAWAGATFSAKKAA